ncbi:hypothetical protein CAEBREN_05602 [Caenorhabditis brenneri]|uniref:Uncharacterized protein n=1 Tax=Caenorhabditis brenneri TaxID=135651 RepID=G0P8K1_CAEBE|nr:hypothetical protein CAEBREN_05602 [Caenorhabditis brenneri]
MRDEDHSEEIRKRIDSEEIAEKLDDLRQVLSESAEDVKLTRKQLENLEDFLELAKCRTHKAKKAKEAAMIAETERQAKEQQRERDRVQAMLAEVQREREQREREMRTRLHVAEEQAKVEDVRRSLESSLVERAHSTESESSFVEDDEIEEPTSNMPTVDFLSFIQSDGAYLMLKKEADNVVNTLTREGLGYPLGVAYDEKLKHWLICDRNLNKIIVFNMDEDDYKICDGVDNPTAVIIYKEGHNAAILCSDKESPGQPAIYIYNYNTNDPYIQCFASHSQKKYGLNHQLRGLAKSVSGNLLSLEHGRPAKKLRVFKRDVGGKGFEIRGSQSPCFIATYRSTVAVSDLIVNKVFILNLDDRDWGNVSCQVIRIIESGPEIPLDVLANQNGFRFVAGMQFDINGHLLIGDAKGHSIKLYDSTDYNFLHRVSSDFVLPYVSSFHVNQNGECMLLDVKGHKKVHWVKMTSIPDILPWMGPGGARENGRRQDHQQNGGRSDYQNGGRPDYQQHGGRPDYQQQKPRRGGYQNRN